MSLLPISKKVECLVRIFDHRLLNISVDIPKGLEGTKLLPSVVERYHPKLGDRVFAASWSLLATAYKNQFPEGTAETFQTFMRSQAGHQSLQETLQHVSTTLPEKVSAEELQKIVEEARVEESTEVKK